MILQYVIFLHIIQYILFMKSFLFVIIYIYIHFQITFINSDSTNRNLFFKSITIFSN